MKRVNITLSCICVFALMSCAQSNWKDQLNQANKTLNEALGGNTSELTNTEVISGLREALKVGTNNSTAKTAKTDGFYKNPRIAIPFPEDAIKVKNTAEDLGMKNQVDKFVLTLNRAAEEATKQAAPIFIDAITSMSIADGFKILNGPENAATQYLRQKTHAQLTAKFQPKVEHAIKKVQLTKYWNPIITKYNSVTAITGGAAINPDLEAYVTEMAIDGLFTLIADEEKSIRKDPAARVSAILRRVFGQNP